MTSRLEGTLRRPKRGCVEYIIYQKETIHDLIVAESVRRRHDIGALCDGPCLAGGLDSCRLTGIADNGKVRDQITALKLGPL